MGRYALHALRREEKGSPGGDATCGWRLQRGRLGPVCCRYQSAAQAPPIIAPSILEYTCMHTLYHFAETIAFPCSLPMLRTGTQGNITRAGKMMGCVQCNFLPHEVVDPSKDPEGRNFIPYPSMKDMPEGHGSVLWFCSHCGKRDK